MDDINIHELFETFLNGGAPRTDWDDVKEWAEKLLRVNELQKTLPDSVDRR